jgi:hypothetical protein
MTPASCRQFNDINHDQHDTNWADLVCEELSETIEAAQDILSGKATDSEALLAELDQLGALVIAWSGKVIEQTMTHCL